jgi:hypothetical protein
MPKLGIKEGLGVFLGTMVMVASARTQEDDPKPRASWEEMTLPLQLTPPLPERLFQLRPEEQVREQIRADYKNKRLVEFPATTEPVPASQPPPRMWPFLVASVEPGYVCYKRLWFEQRNSERYGWDCGVLEPMLAAGVFYTDMALLPVRWATSPFRCYDCSAGQCLPGDPVPFLWSPARSK